MAKNKLLKGNISELIPDEVNFNKGTEYGQSLIERSLRQFGAGRSILIDKNNRIIAGNKTIENAGQIGLENLLIVETDGTQIVAVKRSDVDLNTKEGRELALADNATGAANLEWNPEALSVATEKWAIDSEGWGVPIEFKEEELDYELREDEYDPPNEVDIETDIKEGDIFEIRKGDICHRVMCGDSRSLIDVTKLMGGKRADLIVTDPPYNVDYASKNELLNKSDKGNRIQTDIENDKMGDPQFKAFLKDAYTRMAESSKPGAPIYVFHASRESVNFIEELIGAGFLFKQQLIWVKNNIVLGRQDYQWQHEPVLYGWKEGAAHYFINDRTQRTVMEDKIDFNAMSKKELLNYIKEIQNDNDYPSSIVYEDKPLVNAEHPTMKPVKLVGRFIRNSSRVKELVIDFFLGSGSTLVGAHQLERNCYGMELSPKYCQVILDRIQLFDPEVEVTKIE